MRIKRLQVDGFRCLVNFDITFEDDLTVIVGENDSGKTSLIECLKVITQNKPVEVDDFTHGNDSIWLKVEIDNFVFEKQYKRVENDVQEESFVAKPTATYISQIKERLESKSFNIGIEENQNYVKNIAKAFGLIVRSNSNIGNLVTGILEKIKTGEEQELIIENTQFPQFNNIQLTGRQFENVSSFFKEVFLKEKQASIWFENISENTTVEEFIKSRVSTYSEEITSTSWHKYM